MGLNLLHGAWTYRSFYNEPSAIDTLDQLLLAEGELVFEDAPEGGIRGQLAFRSDPPQATDARLTLAGAFQNGTPVSTRFQGVGLDDTSAKGWIYDYVGYLVPDWPDGKSQRDAIIGSVIRTVEHAGAGGKTRPAGAVYSFVAVRRDFPEPSVVIPLPKQVLAMLASRHHRLHHLVWHSVRNSWLDSETTDKQRKQVTDLGWAPREPALDPNGTPLVSNSSGEDFLFMHRQMVLELAKLMKSLKLPPIQGWKSIPAPGPIVHEPDFGGKKVSLPVPGNPDGYAVPPTWYDPTDEITNRRIETLKSDEHFWTRMRWWDREFKNPAYLATLSLGALGSLIEWSIHNDMHMRWASVPRDPETGLPIPLGRQNADIAKKWDNPIYDFLGEFYSSHVNPVFWRLHGWVDDRINDWFAAHESVQSGEIRQADVDGTPWFEPGTWVSASNPWAGPMGMMHMMYASNHPGHHHPDDDIAKMEKVVAILFGTPARPSSLGLSDIEPRLRRKRHHRLTRF